MRCATLVLLAAVLALAACRKEKKEIPPRPWTTDPTSPAAVASPPPTGAARASAPLEVKLRAPYALKAGRKASLALFALEGTAVVPDWAASGSDPSAVRDDDLMTAWTCVQTDGARPCAIGVTLPEEAEVHVIRLFPGSAASMEEFNAHARPRSVRVHTDMGWAEVNVKRGWDHRHILLPAGITTRSVVVEVTAVRPGRADRSVHIAELEVFGVTGRPRAAMEIEPRAAIVRFEGGMWKEPDESSRSEARPAFVELADGKGGSRRLLRGTGLVGWPGDRFFLVENRSLSDCSSAKGSYTLVDTRTRLFWDVGDLGGLGVNVFRHPSGSGFATAGWDGSRAHQVGGVLVEANMFRMLEDRKYEFVKDTDVARWGFTGDGRECCPSVDEMQWQELCKAMPEARARKLLGQRTEAEWTAFWAAYDGSGSWLQCRIDGSTRFIVYQARDCGPTGSAMATMDASGGIADFRMATGLRLGAEVEHRRLVEVTDGNGGSILSIGEDGLLAELYPSAVFSLAPPAACACPGE